MGLSSTPLTAVNAFTTNLYPPQAGTPVLAADVEAGEQVLLNRTHNLNLGKLDLAGGTMTGAITLDNSASSLVAPSGSTIQIQPGAVIDIADNKPSTSVAVEGKIRFVNDGELLMDSGTLTQLLGKTRIQARESLSDADHNLDVNSNNNRIIMRTSPTANRVLTLLKASASPAPVAGDWFEVTVLLGTSAFFVALQQEGAGGSVYVGFLLSDGSASANIAGTIVVEYDGTNWRFASGGGSAFYGSGA